MRYQVIFCLVFFFLNFQTYLSAQVGQSNQFISSSLSASDYLSTLNTFGIENNLGSAEIHITDETSFFDLTLAPTYGRFLSERWLLGSSFVFKYALREVSDVTLAEEYLTLSPFVRYYFNLGASKTHFFSEAGFSKTYRFRDSELNPSSANLSLGFTHFLNESIALDGKIGYTKRNVNDPPWWRLQAQASVQVFLTSDFQEYSLGARKGSVLTGINDLAFSVNKEGDRELYKFLFNTKVLYFFTHRLAVGAGVELDVDRLLLPGNWGDVRVLNTRLGFTPQLRYYFMQSGRVMLFSTAGLCIQHKKQIIEDLSNIFNDSRVLMETSNFTNVETGLGANIFLTPNFAFEFGPSLRYYIRQDIMRFGIDAGLQVFFNRLGN